MEALKLRFYGRDTVYDYIALRLGLYCYQTTDLKKNPALTNRIMEDIYEVSH